MVPRMSTPKACRVLTEVDGVSAEWDTAPQELADTLAWQLAILARRRGCADAA